MPFPIVWIYLTGVALLAAALSILINKKMKLATLLLAIMLVIFALSMHLPNMIGGADEMTKMMGMSSFFKDMGLAGGALFISSTAED